MAAAIHLTRTYDEAYALLLEARSYAVSACGQRIGRDSEARLAHSCESLRLTARLAQIVAWLLAQKAHAAGELSAEDLSRSEYRLGGEKVCLDWQSADQRPLPPALKSLLRRSYDLYCRVRRLDGQFTDMQRAPVSRPPGAPCRSA